MLQCSKRFKHFPLCPQTMQIAWFLIIKTASNCLHTKKKSILNALHLNVNLITKFVQLQMKNSEIEL